MKKEMNNVSTYDLFKYVAQNMETGGDIVLEALAGARDASDIGTLFSTMPTLANEWMTTYTNKVSLQKAENKMWEHPLIKMFWKGDLPVGETIEDVLFDLIQCNPYDMNKDGSANYKDYTQKMPEHAYYTKNMRRVYIQTKYMNQFVRAFTSWGAVQRALDAYDVAFFNSIREDTFLLIRANLAKNILNKNMRKIALPASWTNKKFLETQRNAYDGMKYLSPNFTKTFIPNYGTNVKMLMDYKMKNRINVNEFSSAYGPQYEQMLGDIIELNDFAFAPWEMERINKLIYGENTAGSTFFSSADLTALKKIKGVVFDPDVLQQYRTDTWGGSEYDIYGRKTNVVQGMEEVWAYSPFCCAVAIGEYNAIGVMATKAGDNMTITESSGAYTVAGTASEAGTASFKLTDFVPDCTVTVNATSGVTAEFDDEGGILVITYEATRTLGSTHTVVVTDGASHTVTINLT